MLDFQLYAITHVASHPGRDVLVVMEEAIQGGADMIQLRDKDASLGWLYEKAKALRELTRAYGVKLIINDHVDIALAVDADGIHLGQDDLPVHAARTLLGEHKIIGVSTSRIEQARQAVRDGADYIGAGPVFPTATKDRAPVGLEYVRQVAGEIPIPFVAIGGIDLQNADQVIAAGAKRICAVTAIVGSNDVIRTCQAFREKLQVLA